MAASRHIVGTTDLNLIEAPVTWRAYMICGFASFGGMIVTVDLICIPTHEL